MGSQEVGPGAGREGQRERWLWIAAAAWVALIYSTLYFVRVPIEFLRERNLLRLTVVAAFLLAAATVLFCSLRRRPSWRGVAVLGVFATAYLSVFLSMERAEEKLHFIEYGVLGGLVYAALLERRGRCQPTHVGGRWRRWWPAPAAVLLTSLLGWGDEGIQAILPNRVYELRDVGLNVAAALLAVAAMSFWRWVERPGQ